MTLRRHLLSLFIAIGILLTPAISHSQVVIIPNCDLFPEDPFCQEQCTFDPTLPWCEEPEPDNNSNIAFIPGFQGSRLYRQGILGEDELWVPSINQDAKQLFLNDAGEPIDPNIYTRDVIDKAYGLDVYESFIQFMDNMIGANAINEWRALPYDWRFSLDDVANLPEITQTLEDLAASSANGKVTIITHSNGGLVAKALLTRLEQQKQAGESDLIDSIDRLIMVAAPQLGAPKTLVGLLHGDDQNLGGGFLVRKSTARELGENMPGAYSLLPSADYFNTIADPVIQFTDEVASHYDFKNIYGDTVDTFSELTQFLTGDNGNRTEPEASDTDSPNVLNTTILNDANNLRTNILDNWAPPDNLAVTQIAGWGLDTIFAIEYDDCDFCPFGKDLSNLDREAQETIDGDGTVLTTSAMPENNNNSYYANLREINRLANNNFSHRNILGSSPVQDLLTQIISKATIDLPNNITREMPEPDPSNTRYRLRLKSPVAIHIYDSSNRHTGIIDNPDPKSDLQLYEEQIPNSSYFELGEKKYVSLDKNDTYTIKLDSEGTGTFTLEIDTVQEDKTTETNTYNNIPTAPDLKGELTLSPEISQPELSLDIEGDGETDTTVAANTPLDTKTSLALLKQAIRDTNARHFIKKIMQVRVRVAERLLHRNLTHPADRVLRNLDRFIEHITSRRRGLTQEEALSLRKIIATIRRTL